MQIKRDVGEKADNGRKDLFGNMIDVVGFKNIFI
jgi:hypothetical protein